VLEISLGVLLVLHGVVTTAIWVSPAAEDAPFTPSHSWLLGETPIVSGLVATVAGLLLMLTGVGVLADLSWWPEVAVTAGGVGTVLMLVWFHLWLSLGLAINVAVLAVGLAELVGS
jgi:hypothetical protein